MNRVALVVIGALVVFGLWVAGSSFYTVDPDEVVVLTRWGKIVDPHVGPGLHWKTPIAETANHQVTLVQEIVPKINDKPVNTYTNTRCWWHAILKCA